MTSEWKKKLLSSMYHDEPNANLCREVVTKKKKRLLLAMRVDRNRVMTSSPFRYFFYGVLQRGMLRSVFSCWPTELLVLQHRVWAAEESTQPRRFFSFFFPSHRRAMMKTLDLGRTLQRLPGRVGGSGGGWWRRRAPCCKRSLKCHSSNMLPVNSR